MDWTLFALFAVTCFVAAATGRLFQPGAWYDGLRKPGWTPKPWVFPVVWTVLYIAIAMAAARAAGQPGSGPALAFWALQIALNTLWSPVFFGLRRMGLAMGIIAALWLAVLGAMLSLWQVDALAGLLFAPYLVWVSIAAALNFSVWRLNRGVPRAA